MLFNTIYNTRPLVLHSPGENKRWPELKNKFFQTKKKKMDLNDLTIITWNNTSRKGVLEKSMDHLGLNYQVLGSKIVNWNNRIKISLTIEALGTIRTEYVMGIDSFDAILTGNPSKILDKFKQTNKELMFNATPCNYPSFAQFAKQDRLISTAKTIYGNLNAGVWIGKKDFCYTFFNAAKNINSKKYPQYNKSEQLLVRLAVPQFQDSLCIDSLCESFQVINYPNCYEKRFREDLGVIWKAEINRMHL